ncbi:hypothetical protein BDQ17DRAFT_1315180, partial [Cyathus striatus]
MAWSRVPIVFALLAFCEHIPGASATSSSDITSIFTIFRRLKGIHSVLLIFYFLLALVAAIQTLQSLRLKGRSATSLHQSVNKGIPLSPIIFFTLTTLALVVSYIMGASYVGIYLNEDSQGSNFTLGLFIDLFFQLGQISFFAGLLILLRHVAHVNQVAYWNGKAIIDRVSIFLLLISSVMADAHLSNDTVNETEPSNAHAVSKMPPPNAHTAFAHPYVVFYVLTAINIVTTTTYVKQKSRHLVEQNQILIDTAFFIRPLMVILALYELLQDILVWTIKNIDYDTLSAANLIIVGSTFAIMIGVAISAVKQQHQQETENVKGQDYV